MKKVVFLYSGEGTKSIDSSNSLIKTSQYWPRIETILNTTLDISLEELWQTEIDNHTCPQSPLLTVISQICLSDIWKRWGYRPDLVIGHSIGELSAAFQAGFYTLEEILLLTYKIGEATAKIDGTMLHGALSEEQIGQLEVQVSSQNFVLGEKKHVTVSGYDKEMTEFLKSHPEFQQMKPKHPWHHPHYVDFTDQVDNWPADKSRETLFVSGVTTTCEKQLSADHWKRWLTGQIDFISAMQSVKDAFPQDEIDIIEIGFHPVLEKCCDVFESFTYVSSMYRGEDEAKWIIFQRKKLSQENFISLLHQTIEGYRPGLDFSTPLAYQGFTSLTFVEFAALLEPFFPSLAPQDFYRYKSVEQLIDQFGTITVAATTSHRQYQRNQVVIAGMSCKFPSSVENLPQFWQTLRQGEDQVKGNAGRGDFEAGFLGDEISRFDHRYFNISEAEAKTMDPQQIMALELTELLWRDAGIDPTALDRKRVGVYIGAWNNEYQGNSQSVYYPTGTNPSIIASRISFHYDLRGPSWVANTACSSSLLAIHYACKDIEAGRIDFAIAGGVNMILGNDFTHVMRDSGFLSKDQRCKAFDDSANGYVRAEGGGLVLLVNKDFAEKYYAEILGSSINQNGGRTQVITAPHPEAQEELIVDACQDANISPADIAYIECHGTGTKIGDPIEISAIQNTVGLNRKTTCHLGSVKSNLGHLESAAGIAGLLKSVLILNHGLIPGNLHFNKPNQFIDFDSYHLNVVAEETALDQKALIGVSSFGFGGANAHIIIKGVEEEHKKEIVEQPNPFNRDQALPLTAYFHNNKEQDHQTITEPEASASVVDVRQLVEQIFFDLTGIQGIDPDVELTDQGLDSLSATQFVTSLQEGLGVELDVDLIFDNPLLDSLVAALEEKSRPAAPVPAPTAAQQGRTKLSKEGIASLVASKFQELTNISEINPDIELTDQGLDSLSATELIAQLEVQLGIAIDTDILFEYPLYEQLVDEIHAAQ